MKNHLITAFLIFTLTVGAIAQTKPDYIVFYKPYTAERETNVYTTGPIKFDYNTQYTNVKKANISEDLGLAIKHNDYRFIGISGNSYLLPGLEGYIKNEKGVKGWGHLKKYEKYINKYKFKIIEGTSDAINSNAPPLQSAAYDYAIQYNKLLLTYFKGHKMP